MSKLSFVLNAFENPTDNCVIWAFSKDKDGYGWLSHSREKRAHRVAYKLFYGDIPKGMCVMHTCDNPSCINIKHLRLGTHAENMKDKANKKRGWSSPERVAHINNQGELHGNAKVNEEIVNKIKNLFQKQNFTQRQIAQQFSISRQTVSDIVRGVTWTHVRT